MKKGIFKIPLVTQFIFALLLCAPFLWSLVNAIELSPHDWFELEVNQSTLLTQAVKLTPSLTLMPGLEAKITDMGPLPSIKVNWFQFSITRCTPELKVQHSPLVMDERNEYGFQLLRGCKLDVYVESKDLGRTSVFQAKAE